MIVQLLPEQIAQQWPVIRHAMEQALPPIASKREERMNRLLEQLLVGRVQCWVCFRMEDERTVVESILTTTEAEDVTGERALLIYTLYGTTHGTQETWEDGLKKLKAWARAAGYSRITAYTQNPRVLEWVAKLGGDASYTYVMFDTAEGGA